MKTRLLLFFIVAFIINVKNTVAATTYTWTGTSNANWNNNANWSPSTGHPVAGDIAQIPTTATKPTVNVASACSSITITGTTTITLSAPLTVSGALTVNAVLTFAGTSTASIGGATTFGYNISMVVGASNTITFASGSTVTLGGNSSNFITNSGTLVFATSSLSLGYQTALNNSGTCSFTSSTVTLSGSPCSIANTGTFKATSTTFTLSGSTVPITNSGAGVFTTNKCTFSSTNTGNTITNSATFRDHGSTFNITGQNDAISNSGASANFHGSGTTFTFSTGNNGHSITNSGTFTIDSLSTFNLGTMNCVITNSGTFSSSSTANPCTFNLTGQNSNINNTSTGTFTDDGSTFNLTDNSSGNAITNSGTFNGSNSYIDLAGNYSNITNNSGAHFTVNGTGTIYEEGVSSSTNKISNAGTFYAGTSNSSCEIILDDYCGILNQSTGTFYLGSTSYIHFYNTSAHNCNITNTSPGTFTLQSDANGSAAIDAIPQGNNNNVTGTFNVERYLQGGAGYRSYRLLSSAVYAATVSSNHVYDITYLKNSIFLTGTSTTGGFDNIVAANPTLYLYRENLLTTAFSTFLNSDFRGINKINNSPTYGYSMDDAAYPSTYNLPVGSGFLCFFRGNRSTSFAYKTTKPFPVPENTTLTATGTINTGTIVAKNWFNPGSSNLSFTSTAPALYQGFNLVGNPYPSTIDWETFSTSSGSGIYGTSISASTIYVLNPLTDNYDTYQKGGGYTNHGTRYIASGQAFFVKATCTCAQLTFYETAKAATSNNTGLNLFMSTSADQTANVQYLRLQLAKDSINTDDMLIRFNKGAVSQYDDNVDAAYRQGYGQVSLCSMSSDYVPLAISVQPLPKTSETIALNVNTSADGNYQLNMKNITGIPQLYDIWLMDAYKKDSLDMRHNATYSFDVIKSDTNTYGSKRFSLVIRQNPAYAYRLLNFTASKINTPIN
ncbi:MAG: beta strand repeat-containing protein, partial [Mucilaginibacter sp.]